MAIQQKSCLHCKRTFTPWRGNPGKFCSRRCNAKGQHRERKPLADRFFPFVNKTDGCWLWTGADDGDCGYGRVTVFVGDKRKTIGAHRASWMLHFGPIPEEMEICHHCDNPPCVNPAHLFVGTRSDNQKDSYAKGRHKIVDNRGEKCGSAILTAPDVIAIRQARQQKTMSVTNLAAKYGVHVQTVYSILQNKRWRHIL